MNIMDEMELKENGFKEMQLARIAIATNEWKDREEALNALAPSFYLTRKLQARKLLNRQFANTFVKLMQDGRLPTWVVNIADFDTIKLASDF